MLNNIYNSKIALFTFTIGSFRFIIAVKMNVIPVRAL